MNGIYLLSGSNLGDRLYYLSEALSLLEQKAGAVKAQSSLYQTAAWGKEEQPPFLNQVVELATDLPPVVLMQELLAIEEQLGRQRTEAWGARTLDLDLLYYDDLVLNTPSLSLPHPRLHLRRFTLVPLCELAPLFMHPVLQKNNLQLLRECPDQLEVDIFEL